MSSLTELYGGMSPDFIKDMITDLMQDRDLISGLKPTEEAFKIGFPVEIERRTMDPTQRKLGLADMVTTSTLAPAPGEDLTEIKAAVMRQFKLAEQDRAMLKKFIEKTDEEIAALRKTIDALWKRFEELNPEYGAF